MRFIPSSVSSLWTFHSDLAHSVSGACHFSCPSVCPSRAFFLVTWWFDFDLLVDILIWLDIALWCTFIGLNFQLPLFLLTLSVFPSLFFLLLLFHLDINLNPNRFKFKKKEKRNFLHIPSVPSYTIYAHWHTPNNIRLFHLLLLLFIPLFIRSPC